MSNTVLEVSTLDESLACPCCRNVNIRTRQVCDTQGTRSIVVNGLEICRDGNPVPPRHDFAGRFWYHVEKRGLNECWPWKGTLRSSGYGEFKADGRRFLAHRVAYVLSKGPLPPSKPIVRHSCDNRGCMNPKHLFAGTSVDNQRGPALKGHLARKLSIEKVREMKRLFTGARGELSRLAQEFGVSPSVVSLIRSGKRWVHVV